MIIARYKSLLMIIILPTVMLFLNSLLLMLAILVLRFDFYAEKKLNTNNY